MLVVLLHCLSANLCVILKVRSVVSTALLYNKDGINDFPFSSGYNVVASQPDGSTR